MKFVLSGVHETPVLRARESTDARNFQFRLAEFFGGSSIARIFPNSPWQRFRGAGHPYDKKELDLAENTRDCQAGFEDTCRRYEEISS